MPKIAKEKIQKKDISCIPINLFEKIVNEMKTEIEPKHIRAAISKIKCEIFRPYIITEFFLDIIFSGSFELLEPYKRTDPKMKAQSEIHAKLMARFLPGTLQELGEQGYLVKCSAGRYMLRKEIFAMSSAEERSETEGLCEELKKRVKNWVDNYIQKKVIQISQAETVNSIGFWQPVPTTHYYQLPQSLMPQYYEESLEDAKINSPENNNF